MKYGIFFITICFISFASIAAVAAGDDAGTMDIDAALLQYDAEPALQPQNIIETITGVISEPETEWPAATIQEVATTLMRVKNIRFLPPPFQLPKIVQPPKLPYIPKQIQIPKVSIVQQNINRRIPKVSIVQQNINRRIPRVPTPPRVVIPKAPPQPPRVSRAPKLPNNRRR